MRPKKKTGSGGERTTGASDDPFFFKHPAERLTCATCGKKTRARWASVLQGWYSGPNGAHYCGSRCSPKPPDGKRRPRQYCVTMTAPEGATPDDLDRWAAWARRQFFEIMRKTDAAPVPELRQEEELARLRERAARSRREAERLRSEAARLEREADLLAAPGESPPGSPPRRPGRRR